jgi:hypothetical protein
MAMASDGPADIEREEQVHPTVGPHTNRARTRLQEIRRYRVGTLPGSG